MNTIINYLKTLIIPIGAILVFPLLFSLFNLLGLNISNIFILIMMIIVMLISGYYIGKKVEKRGYINGLLIGFITSLLYFILSLFFKNTYGINSIIYYAIILSTSTIGSMLGIQKKTND